MIIGLIVYNDDPDLLQKRHRIHRETIVNNMIARFHDHVSKSGSEPVNFRDVFQSELFGLALKQVSSCLSQSDSIDVLDSVSNLIVLLSCNAGNRGGCGVHLCGGTWRDPVETGDIQDSSY